MSMWRTFVVSMALSFAVAGVSIAADPSRGSTTPPSPSGQEGADIEKDRSTQMGGMEKGETSLKQEEIDKQNMDRSTQDTLSKDEFKNDKADEPAAGTDPLEKQDPGPGPRSADPTGGGKSSGIGAGQ